MAKTRKEIYLNLANQMLRETLERLDELEFDVDDFEIEIKLKNLEFKEEIIVKG